MLDRATQRATARARAARHRRVRSRARAALDCHLSDDLRARPARARSCRRERHRAVSGNRVRAAGGGGRAGYVLPRVGAERQHGFGAPSAIEDRRRRRAASPCTSLPYERQPARRAVLRSAWRIEAAFAASTISAAPSDRERAMRRRQRCHRRRRCGARGPTVVGRAGAVANGRRSQCRCTARQASSNARNADHGHRRAVDAKYADRCVANARDVDPASVRQPQRRHGHLVAGQRASLVGADRARRTEGLDGAEAPHDGAARPCAAHPPQGRPSSRRAILGHHADDPTHADEHDFDHGTARIRRWPRSTKTSGAAW